MRQLPVAVVPRTVGIRATPDLVVAAPGTSAGIRYSRVVDVLDVARGAGAERIGLVGVEAAAR